MGHLAHWGFFLTPHPKPLLRASFCANKKFQAYYGKTAVFQKSFRKIFQRDPFLKNCLHDITVLSQTFWLFRKTNSLAKRFADRQFPPNVEFLHRNTVSLDKLPTFRKKLFAKNKKKNSQWAIWPTGDFFFDPSSQTSFACVILR